MKAAIISTNVLRTEMPDHVVFRTKLLRIRADSFRNWGCFDGDMFLYANEVDNPLWDPAKELMTVRDIGPVYDDHFIQENAPDPGAFRVVGNMHMTKLFAIKHFIEENPQYDVIMMTDVDVLAVRDVNPLLRAVTPESPLFLSVGPAGSPMGDWRGANGYLSDAEVRHSRKIRSLELCSCAMLGTSAMMADMASFAIETVRTRRYRIEQGLNDHYEQAAVNYWAYKNHGKFRYFGRKLLQGPLGAAWMRPAPDVCLVHFFNRGRKQIVPFVENWERMR